MATKTFAEELDSGRDYESRVANFEHYRNAALDRWFAARDGKVLKCAENEAIFEGGFRMAWELFRGGQI